MRFPRTLLKRNRTEIRISLYATKSQVFIRFKPEIQWTPGEDIPRYDQIRTENQSCNWDLLSIPIWVRFDDSKNYKDDYAVVGIFLAHLLKKESNEGNYFWKIEHKPLDNNYSHCDLSIDGSQIPKSVKRQMKLELKHSQVIHFKPYEKPDFLYSLKERFFLKFRKIQYYFNKSN